MTETIHHKALSILGAEERLLKLREEIKELGDSVENVINGFCDYENLVHEILDVQYVLRSVRLIPELKEILAHGYIKTHEFGDGEGIVGAQEKLQKAIDEKEGAV